MKKGLEEEELVQMKCKGKVITITRHEGSEWKDRGSSTISLTSALGGGGRWSTLRSGHFTPGIKTRYSWYRRLGGPQVPVCTCAEYLTHTGTRFKERPARSESRCRLSYSGGLLKLETPK